MKKLALVSLAILLAGAFLAPASFAHEGDLDACGGHVNAEGVYEVHDLVLYDACKEAGTLGPTGEPIRHRNPLLQKATITEEVNVQVRDKEGVTIRKTGETQGIPITDNDGAPGLSNLAVYVNGQVLRFDVSPTIVNGRTLVPRRAIFEALGAQVTWDQPSQTALATWAGGEMSLQIGAESATVKGQTKKLDVPGQLIGGRTMVPLRFVAEALGAQVGWYGGSKTITINRPVAGLISGTVTKVVDGDTSEVTMASDAVEKVRLIGVDTPETVHPTKGVQPYGPGQRDHV